MTKRETGRYFMDSYFSRGQLIRKSEASDHSMIHSEDPNVKKCNKNVFLLTNRLTMPKIRFLGDSHGRSLSALLLTMGPV